MKKGNPFYIIGSVFCLLGIFTVIFFQDVSDHIEQLCLTPIYTPKGEIDYVIPQYPLGFSGDKSITLTLLLVFFGLAIILLLIGWQKDKRKSILLAFGFTISITIAFVIFLNYWESIKSHYEFAPKIRELESVDIDLEFSDNMKKKDYRVVVIMEYGEHAPGFRDYEDHAKRYGKRRIEGTSDCIASQAESTFNQAAMNYAKKYNQKLIKYLKQVENINQQKH